MLFMGWNWPGRRGEGVEDEDDTRYECASTTSFEYGERARRRSEKTTTNERRKRADVVPTAAAVTARVEGAVTAY